MILSFCCWIIFRGCVLISTGRWSDRFFLFIFKQLTEFIIIESQDETYSCFNHLTLNNGFILVFPLNPYHIASVLAELVIHTYIACNIIGILSRIGLFKLKITSNSYPDAFIKEAFGNIYIE